MTFVFEATSEQATERFGAALAAVLPPRTAVALCGTLGAGKTRLVQAIAAAYGVPREDVVSPTFVLCHGYFGTRTVYHLDAYRLNNAGELLELGIEEQFHSDAVTFIEWADRVLEVLPAVHLRIEIEITGETSRRFTVRPSTPQLSSVLSALQAALPGQRNC